MRRILPWALVAMLIGVGTGGALAGLAAHPSTTSGRSLAGQVMAATRDAGTARFAYSSRASSTNPLLRSSSVGVGVVSFTDGTMSTLERDRHTDLSGSGGSGLAAVSQTLVIREIWIGRTSYLRLDIPGLGGGAHWIKAITFPAHSFGSLGSLGTIGALSELATDATVRGLQVTNVGGESIHGVPATRYLLVRPTCAPMFSRTQPTASVGPTEVWVDGQGRLVQARSVTHSDIPRGALVGTVVADRGFAGRSTIVSTIRFYDFGAPLSISAPKVIDSQSSGSEAFALRSGSACPR